MATAAQSRAIRPNRSSLRCQFCGYGHSDVCWIGGYFCPNPACQRFNDKLYREEHLDPGKAMFMSKTELLDEYRRAGMPLGPVHLSKDTLNTLRNPDWRPEHPRRAS